MLINKITLNNLNSVDDGFINVPLSLDFSPEAQHFETIEDNFDIIKSDYINSIIDYEKIKIYPCIYTTGATNANHIKEINAIQFSLHFYLNDNWTSGSTKYHEIGFSSDDIIYRRKKLQRSFIRLSYFDSKDFKTQNLLYYSTIFIDCDKLYSEYIKNGNTLNLSLDITSENPKLSNKIKTFEGFGLYLFKNDLNKREEKKIYLRIDFNNAMNGRTVLFTKKLSNPLLTNGYTMQDLYNGMYFEISCKYDWDKNKYVACFDLDKENSEDSGVYEITSNIDLDDVKITNTLKLNVYQAKVI